MATDKYSLSFLTDLSLVLHFASVFSHAEFNEVLPLAHLACTTNPAILRWRIHIFYYKVCSLLESFFKCTFHHYAFTKLGIFPLHLTQSVLSNGHLRDFFSFLF